MVPLRHARPRTSAANERAPAFSFVVAVYNAELYLPEFLASIDALDWPADELEVILVDDCSTDGSAELINDWLAGTRFPGRLCRRPNGGPGAARNTGLEYARGCWISFPDSDDVLSPDYLRTVDSFTGGERAGTAAMVAARLVQFVDDTRSPIAPHKLDFKYADPERIVDVELSPRFVHLHTNNSFFRGDLIRSLELRYDESVRPVFEDAVFNATYLAAAPRPTIAFLGRATYFYRKRADQGSLTGSAWQDPAMFDRLPQRGYLALLERFGPSVPRWVQNLVFYDLQWFFKTDSRARSAGVELDQAALARFHRTIDEIVQYLDEATLLEFHAVDIPVRVRLSLVARKGAGLPVQNASVVKLDYAQQIMMITYLTDQPEPDEDVRVDGVQVTPTFAKTTGIRYFGRIWLYQRDIWVPALRPVSLRVGGRLLPIVYAPPAGALFESVPRDVWRRYAGASVPRPLPVAVPAPHLSLVTDTDVVPPVPARKRRSIGQRLAELTSRPTVRLGRRLVRAAGWSFRLAVNDAVPVIAAADLTKPGLVAAVHRRAATARVRAKFHDAWVLIDRDVAAQDNAEAFYRYLQAEHPEVNAWFVLSRSSADWDRLAADGFRLLEFDSIEYGLALHHASYLLSSQADDYVARPRRSFYGRHRWKFVFLQHGVIHNDLSRWINTRPIRLMITTTEAEHRSIVGHTSPYTWSEKEVEQTGMPRQDRLLALAQTRPERRSILIAPTWRDYLLGPQQVGHRRALRTELESTPFFLGWQELLTDPALRELAAREDVDLVFLAHPHLQHHLDPQLLPPGLRMVTAATCDIQRVITAARLMITDYSSLAFDAAYVDTPTVYYQFDAADFFSGRHTVRAGEFRHDRDGFGPVVSEPSAVIAAAAELLDPESSSIEEYRRRMAATFTFRDGRCSHRVFEAIRRRELPVADPVTATESQLMERVGVAATSDRTAATG